MKMEIILCMRWLKVVSSCICDQRLEFLLSESWEIPEPEVCPNLTSCLLVWNIWIFCSRRYHKCIDFRQILLWNDRWLSRQPVSHLQPAIEFGPKNQRSVPLGNYFAIRECGHIQPAQKGPQFNSHLHSTPLMSLRLIWMLHWQHLA